nr:S8 family peptidase [uncultured Cellulosilyticum sp.]
MDKSISLTPFDITSSKAQSEIIPEGVKDIKAPDFWNKGYKGRGVTIAIIDTGVEVNHPDLKDRIIGGRNFTSEDGGDVNRYNDYNGHGTHVAGIIAASANGTGVVGVAPEASLLILKILDRDGNGTYESAIAALKYAITQGVDVISMSLGGPIDVPELHAAIQEAVSKEIVVICAAANSGDGNALTPEYAYPAYYSEVISVGAATSSKRVAGFSNSNNQVDLIAPGVNILSTYLNSSYARLSGTSMAAPYVTGAVALLINWGMERFGRKLTELEIYAQLVRRAVSVGLPATAEGNGMLYLTAQDVLEQMLRNNRLT